MPQILFFLIDINTVTLNFIYILLNIRYHYLIN